MKLKMLSGESGKDQPIFTSSCRLSGWVFIRFKDGGYVILEAHIRTFFTMKKDSLPSRWSSSKAYGIQ
jgi:hypothetical protein